MLALHLSVRQRRAHIGHAAHCFTPDIKNDIADLKIVICSRAAGHHARNDELTGLGFNVIDVDNGQAALGVLENHSRVDLLFTDVVLLGSMNGFALAQQVAAQYPTTTILLTSGFPGTRLPDAKELGASVRLLSKPYRKDELAGAVYEALAHDGQRAPPIDQSEGDALGTPTKFG